eukprot:COSAG05_NODE_4127_length_1661_cov_4.093470_1_plen_489_part_01
MMEMEQLPSALPAPHNDTARKGVDCWRFRCRHLPAVSSYGCCLLVLLVGWRLALSASAAVPGGGWAPRFFDQDMRERDCVVAGRVASCDLVQAPSALETSPRDGSAATRAFQLARQQCSWQPPQRLYAYDETRPKGAPASGVALNFEYQHFTSNTDYFASVRRKNRGEPAEPRSNPPPMFAQHCDTPGPGQQQWTITRVGPFHSTGGYDWHWFQWDDFGGFGRWQRQNPNSKRYVTAALMAPVDEGGKVISYPPLHIHHSHLELPVGQGSLHKTGHRVLAEVHGDSSCVRAGGGDDCLLQTFGNDVLNATTSRGTAGLNVSGALWFNTEVNDVRPRGSSDLEWWFEVAVCSFISTDSADTLPQGQGRRQMPPQPLGLLSFGNPYPWHPDVDRNSWNKVFYADATRPSVLWHTAPFPFRGQFLPSSQHVHLHAKWVTTLWALSGPPSALGLNAAPLVLSKPWRPFVPAEHGLSVAELQRKLLGALADAQR